MHRAPRPTLPELTADPEVAPGLSPGLDGCPSQPLQVRAVTTAPTQTWLGPWPGRLGTRTWKDLMNVHSRVRTPSARLSSLISLMTRNRRKKALEMRALSSGSCGPAAPEVSLEVAPHRGSKGQAGEGGATCVCWGGFHGLGGQLHPHLTAPAVNCRWTTGSLKALGLFSREEGVGQAAW